MTKKPVIDAILKISYESKPKKLKNLSFNERLFLIRSAKKLREQRSK